MPWWGWAAVLWLPVGGVGWLIGKGINRADQEAPVAPSVVGPRYDFCITSVYRRPR